MHFLLHEFNRGRGLESGKEGSSFAHSAGNYSRYPTCQVVLFFFFFYLAYCSNMLIQCIYVLHRYLADLLGTCLKLRVMI